VFAELPVISFFPPLPNCLLGKFDFGSKFRKDSIYSKENIKNHFGYCSQSANALPVRGLPKSTGYKAASEVFIFHLLQ